MKTRSQKMEGIKAILDAIQNDLKTKATSIDIEELKSLIQEKDARIEALEKRVDELETKLTFLHHSNQLLERKVDDGEQYQRRPSLRISGIPSLPREVETGDVCLRKVKEEISKLGVDVKKLHFDRAHRVGVVKKDDKGKPLPRQMIFRMGSWSDRTIIYKARNKEKGAKVKFYIDLTKRRFELKKCYRAN